MPEEIDFSNGERGKFYRENMRLRLPVHLDSALYGKLAELADAEGVELSVFVSDLLKKAVKPV